MCIRDSICIMVRDPIDRYMPEVNGYVSISDPYSGRALIIQPAELKYRFEKEVRREEKEISDFFSKIRSDLLVLSTEKPFVGPLIKFFKRRSARWR